MSSVSKCKKAGAVTGELVSLSSSPESIVPNFIFLFVGYTTNLQGVVLHMTEKLRQL